MEDMPEQSKPPSPKKNYALRIVLGVVIILILGGVYIILFTGGDCIWAAPVAAWIDQNRNRVHESDEPRLENVEFRVNDTLNHYSDVGQSFTRESDDQEMIRVWLPGCPATRFEIEAVAPKGYELTTQSPIQDTGWGYGDEQLFEFGFAPIEP